MNLQADLHANTEQFIQSIKDVSDDQFNICPTADNWSVGEIVEHVFRSEFGIPRLFNGPTKAVQRDPSEKIALITNKLSDRSVKYSAFGPILPSEKVKHKTELIRKFTTNREKIARLIETQATGELCTLFKHPFFGELTRLEWIRFCILHAGRHRQQIEFTLQKLNI